MSVMWSGPGRALQTHLDLFAHLDRTATWLKQHEGGPVVLDAMPQLLHQRLGLMSSMGLTLGPVVMVDGRTVATQRDDEGTKYSELNLLRTAGLIAQEHEVLNHGETHYVSHHVASAVAAAAESADDEPLFPTDLPAPQGLIVLEYPLLIPDLHPDTGDTIDGLEMPIRAIGWGKQTVWARKEDGSDEMEPRDGIFYVLYTDKESFRSLFVPSVKRALPDDYAEHFDTYDLGADWSHIWATDASGWSFGKSWKRAGTGNPRDAFAQGEIHDTVAIIRRFLLAYFRWTFQRLIVPRTYTPSRPQRREAARIGMTLTDGYVKVMRLRREVEAEERGERPETDGFYFDHAWIVRGHWTRQHYATLGPPRNPDGSWNEDSHRLIWIEPHVSGNPYGPLVIGHNVTAAVR